MVAQALYRLVTDDELGNGTLLEISAAGERVIPPPERSISYSDEWLEVERASLAHAVKLLQEKGKKSSE